MNYEDFIVPSDKKIKLRDYDPGYTGEFKNKEEASEHLAETIKKMAEYQDILYASNTYSLLIIIQALDAAGKDGIIKHVMSGLNPQGCQVVSFKAPSEEELDHDFLWRCAKSVPQKGNIGIFNRSYYEEVLVVRVHPELLLKQRLPKIEDPEDLWKQRFQQINNFEKYLTKNGVILLKFYLNISKSEQKKRFLKRINQTEKNWKFSAADVKERQYWNDYMDVYEDLINNTSTSHSPWHIIPADNKWFTRAAVGNILVKKLKELNLSYPEVSDQHRQELLAIKNSLEKE